VSEVLASFVPERGTQVVMFLGLVLFTAAAAFVWLTVDPMVLAQASTFIRLALRVVLVLCPVFAVDTLVRLVRRTPTVVATPEGLAFRSILGFSVPIPWCEIGAFRPVIMGKKPWLAIYLDDPAGTFSRLGTWTRLMHAKSHAAGVPNLAFRAISLGASPANAAAVLEGIRERRT